MKHIKEFNQFVNESVDNDRKIAVKLIKSDPDLKNYDVSTIDIDGGFNQNYDFIFRITDKNGKHTIQVYVSDGKIIDYIAGSDSKTGSTIQGRGFDWKKPPTDETIKLHINAYSVADDPYDVAVSIGKKYRWNQREIEKAEKIRAMVNAS